MRAMAVPIRHHMMSMLSGWLMSHNEWTSSSKRAMLATAVAALPLHSNSITH